MLKIEPTRSSGRPASSNAAIVFSNEGGALLPAILAISARFSSIP